MRGVRDELADLHLRALPGAQRPLHVVEHVVERQADLADLGPRIRVGSGDADGHLDLPRVQLQLRHLVGGVGEPLQDVYKRQA